MIKMKKKICSKLSFSTEKIFPQCISFARCDGLLILIKSPVDPHSMNTNEKITRLELGLRSWENRYLDILSAKQIFYSIWSCWVRAGSDYLQLGLVFLQARRTAVIFLYFICFSVPCLCSTQSHCSPQSSWSGSTLTSLHTWFRSFTSVSLAVSTVSSASPWSDSSRSASPSHSVRYWKYFEVREKWKYSFWWSDV